MQGNTLPDALRWWDGVKWFRHGGWSLAGSAGWRGGLHELLHLLLTMRDEGAFTAGQDWLHVLGVSQIKWDVFLTAIQHELRRDNERLQISCDAATAFQQGGQYDKYAVSPQLGVNAEDWVVRYEQIEHLKSLADASNPKPFPVSSPLADLINMHHVLVKDKDFASRRFDTLSNMMLINHSLWVYLDAARRAIASTFTNNTRTIPPVFAEAVDLIGDAFRVENWGAFIMQHKPALDTAAAKRQ